MVLFVHSHQCFDDATLRKADAMGDRIDDLSGRVHALETKMDQVPASIERRFDAVDAAIVEQRRYTEFAFDSIKAELGKVRADISGIKANVSGIKAEFAGVRTDVSGLRAEVSGVKEEVLTISSGLGRLERKLDQFIDLHLPSHRPDTPEQPL